MSEIDEILKEEDNFSELSAEPSFTISDILKEPADEEVEVFQRLSVDEEDLDALFVDEEEQEELQPFNNMEEMFQSQKEQSEKAPTLSEKNQAGNEPQQQIQKVRRWSRLRDYPLPPFEQIKNMVYLSLRNVSELFDLSTSKGVGIPTCISATGTKYLALGTSLGNTVVFETQVKGHRNLSTEDQSKFGQVTSVSVSRDNRYLVAGHESGLIVVWDLYTFKVIKKQLLQKQKILKVLFCENYENFITSDAAGNVYMFTIENYLWTGVKHQFLIDKSNQVFYDIKFLKIKSGRHLLILCSLESILIISLKPNIGVLGAIKRPEGVSPEKAPNCEIGELLFENRRESQNFICVSWGKKIFIYKLTPSNHSMEQVSLDFKMEHPEVIENIQIIANGILVTLDERQVFRVINLNDSKVQEKCIVISMDQLHSETIYQRFLKSEEKSKKYIKIYANTIVNCSFNPKFKEIFLIAKNSIFRGRLFKWTDYINNLIFEQKNWERAMKICTELYKGNFNIFADSFTDSKTSMSVLCDIGKIYLKEKMKEIEKKNLEQYSIRLVRTEAEQLFDIVIEYFCCINCQHYLFKTIFPIISDKYFYQYEELLYSCMQPAIMNHGVKSIPVREIFMKLVETFEKKPEVINEMVTNLEEDSLFFEEIIDVCENQRLYEALCYMCAVNGDFISPLNKIMMHLLLGNEGAQIRNDPAVKESLKQYLNHIITMKYPNDKPIHTDRRVPLLKSLFAWITCDESLKFLIMCFSLEEYFSILSLLRGQLLKYGRNEEIVEMNKQLLSRSNVEQIKGFSGDSLQVLLAFLLETPWSHIRLRANEKKYWEQGEVKVEEEGESNEKNEKNDINYSILKVLKEQLKKQGNIEGLKKVPFCVKVLKYYKQQWIQKYHVTSMQQQQKEKFIHFLLPALSQTECQNLLEIYLPLHMLTEPPKDKLPVSSMKSKQPKLVDENIVLFTISNIDEKYKYEYLDILLKMNPETILLDIIQRGKESLKAINKHLSSEMIPDEKQRYLITRRLLKVIRGESKETRQSVVLDTSILVNYISSLCKFKTEKRVFAEISSNPEEYYHVTSELVPIVKQSKFRSCLAFLYSSQLNYNEAFSEYSLVFAEYFRKNFYKLIAYQHCHGRFMTKIYNYMLDLCLKISQEGQWAKLLKSVLAPLEQQERISNIPTSVIDTIQKISQIQTMSTHPFIKELKETIEQTIGTMGREVSIPYMASQLHKYSTLLNKPFIVGCLVSTLNDFRCRVQGFVISRDLMVEEVVRDFQKYFSKYKVAGISSEEVCQRCGRQLATDSTTTLKNDKSVTYPCGHCYHPWCLEQESECKKCNKEYYGDHHKQDPITDPQNILYYQKQVATINSSKITNVSGSSLSHHTDMADKEKERQIENEKNVYRCLAFDDFIKRKEKGLKEFEETYERYIDQYKAD